MASFSFSTKVYSMRIVLLSIASPPGATVSNIDLTQTCDKQNNMHIKEERGFWIRQPIKAQLK
jgi:hypothetical protein